MNGLINQLVILHLQTLLQWNGLFMLRVIYLTHTMHYIYFQIDAFLFIYFSTFCTRDSFPTLCAQESTSYSIGHLVSTKIGFAWLLKEKK